MPIVVCLNRRQRELRLSCIFLEARAREAGKRAEADGPQSTPLAFLILDARVGIEAAFANLLCTTPARTRIPPWSRLATALRAESGAL